MNQTKFILLIVGALSFSYSFSQSVEQDFSALDKNKDGKIDKSEFQSLTPPPAPVSETQAKSTSPSKQKASEGASSSPEKMSSTSPKEATIEKELVPPSTFESIDKNGDGIIDMDEFKLNHTIVRKRPGATRKAN